WGSPVCRAAPPRRRPPGRCRSPWGCPRRPRRSRPRRSAPGPRGALGLVARPALGVGVDLAPGGTWCRLGARGRRGWSGRDQLVLGALGLRVRLHHGGLVAPLLEHPPVVLGDLLLTLAEVDQQRRGDEHRGEGAHGDTDE